MLKKQMFYTHCVERENAKQARHFAKEEWGYRVDYPDETGAILTVFYNYDGGEWRATEKETGYLVTWGATLKECKEKARDCLPAVRRILYGESGSAARAEFSELVMAEIEKKVRKTA